MTKPVNNEILMMKYFEFSSRFLQLAEINEKSETGSSKSSKPFFFTDKEMYL